MDARDGNLGNGVLRRFNVTFDYSRAVMLLERNERYDEPFEWDMSGMRLAPTGQSGLRIEALVEGSPAAKVGLAIDDVVTHVNGQVVSKDDAQSLRRMLEQDGAVVRVSATRNGEILEFKFKLRRLV
jgi:C-terminal processing protease CtpA/Prc